MRMNTVKKFHVSFALIVFFAPVTRDQVFFLLRVFFPVFIILRNVFQLVPDHNYKCDNSEIRMEYGHGACENLLSPTMIWPGLMLYKQRFSSDQRNFFKKDTCILPNELILSFYCFIVNPISLFF